MDHLLSAYTEHPAISPSRGFGRSKVLRQVILYNKSTLCASLLYRSNLDHQEEFFQTFNGMIPL